MACSLCCGFKRGIASVSKLILTIIQIFKPFILIPKHEIHEHLTILKIWKKGKSNSDKIWTI
jgi:tRNA(Ile)-lysidine synthase TilS/MesJ